MTTRGAGEPDGEATGSSGSTGFTASLNGFGGKLDSVEAKELSVVAGEFFVPEAPEDFQVLVAHRSTL